MVEITGRYGGDLRCTSTHGPSHTTLATDAPRDNEGLGESYSPTDLVATALATCMVTIMGIYGRRHDLDLTATRYRIEKHMSADPRRIGRLVVDLELPAIAEERHREGLRKSAMACPVKRSLHPDIELDIRFHFADAD